MKLFEMEGFLRGKCLPGDMKVNETNAEYLVRKFSEADARCAALAAENAALNGFSDKLNEMHNDLNGEGTGIQGRAEVACQQIALEAAMEEFDDIKTPATDRFLAEQRAQGVEMFAKHCQKRHGEMMKSEPNEAASNQAITAIRRAGELALFFAAQLRKGVQS